MKYSLTNLLEVKHTDIRELEQTPDYTIYCDMDGVLTNFKERFIHYTGMIPNEYEEKYGTPQFWELIDETVGEVFWSDMNWTPSGKQLWNFIKSYSPELLTSPSRNKVSRTGKVKWVKKNLSPTPKVNFKYSKSKQELANKNSILIDDKDYIIENWQKAGGIGIHHPENTSDISPILSKLKELGYE